MVRFVPPEMPKERNCLEKRVPNYSHITNCLPGPNGPTDPFLHHAALQLCVEEVLPVEQDQQMLVVVVVVRLHLDLLVGVVRCWYRTLLETRTWQPTRGGNK